MGVPVVSLTGRIPVSRVGASLLRHVGLQHLAVASADDYIATARALALDRPRLAEIRRSLRQRMRESPLMDEKAFATDLEAAYLSLQTR
jgi:predicted O-linked N-acetylglucosamine transferase (SPINDLY family)